MNKQKIKEITPDRIIYFYNLIKIVPRYLKTIFSDRHKKPQIKFYSDEETIDKIVNQHYSLSRFGDGEFMWMLGKEQNSYQSFSVEMQNDLINSFRSMESNILIGIPIGIFDSKGCNLYAKIWWRIIRKDIFYKIEQYVDYSKIYCNASIARPYIDYHSRKKSGKNFKMLQKIWDKKNLVIIEGSKTKLGIGNDLFSNAQSIRRIICPSENAYEKKKLILSETVRIASKEDVILLALGPTASILAVELANLGYQAIDIGHIDVEYMWFLRKEILRKPIEGKYVNESGIRTVNEKYDEDIEYIQSIVSDIQ